MLQRNSFKIGISLLLLLLSFFHLSAQNNNGIFFQAVARDNFTNPAKDRKIYLLTTIIQSNPSGIKVFAEEHQTNTDAMGVFSISIGNGLRVGGTATNISTIDWSKGPFYLNLKVAITPIGGNSNWDYTKEWMDMGTTSFGAVPYALYSASAAKVDDKLNITDTTAMLKVYAKAASLQALTTQLDSKLSTKDTLSMLAPYAKSAYTIDSIFLKTQLVTKLSIADSSKYITPYQLAGYNFSKNSNNIDTTSLSKRINSKADTADVLNKLSIADSSKYITPYQLAGYNFSKNSNNVDTTSLSNRINLKANISYVDAQISNVTISDADANTKGKIQLAGDLTGTAEAPVIANNAISTNKILNSAITNVKLANGIDATKISGDIAGKASNVTGNIAIQNGGTGAASAANARKNLGLVIGTDVQALLNFTSPLIQNGTTISLNQASSGADGYLSSSDYTSFSNKIDASQKAAINGIASLGNDGKIPSVQIPAISFQSASVVNSETAMLALSGLVVGSIAIRTDVSKNFVLSATPASVLSNWIELSTPNSVTSVNGYAGPNVILTTNDVAEGTNNKYFTISRARAILNVNSPLSYNASSGTISLTSASTTSNGYLSATDFNIFTNKQNALTAGVDYIVPNSSINAASKTKITYDAKGLVIGGVDATTADITPSANRNYVTDIQAGVLSNTSGINTGDQTIVLLGDVVGRGTGTFSTTVNSIGGVSSSTISNFDTRISSNTNSITINTADILLKANITSPNFNGVPTAPTAAAGTNTTQIATTAFVTASTLAAVPDATSSLKGKIKLVNDLGGTADAPTVNSIGGVSSSTISNFDTRISAATSSITANTASINTLNTSIASNTSSITSLLNNSIPYTGATGQVNLGAYDLTVNGVTIGAGAATISNTNNIAFGYNALANNTTGMNNMANGYNALALNSTGYYNTGFGRKALYNNTMGNHNTAIGNMANVGSNNLENATAIGDSAIVTTSNTIQLGNINVTNVKTSGTITAGAVTYPITHGTNGQVLSTTGSGTLTWTTTSAPSDASLSGKGIIQLAGDLAGTASLPSVSSVGGVSASNIANYDTRIISNTNSITTLNTTLSAATSSNTISTIVKRDVSGNFSAGTISANIIGNVTGNLTGNASTATTASTAITAGNITATSNNTLTTISTLSAVGTITSGTISITTDIKTAGKIIAGAVTYPSTHNSISGQVLKVDATGTASWASGASVNIFTDEPVSITAGQTSFTLTNTPISGKVWMYINGTRISKNAYSVSGTTVTYIPSSNNSYVLVVGDRIQFDYVY